MIVRLLALTLLASPALAADDAVLSADRPGVGESPGTPGVGSFNVEGGLQLIIPDEGSIAPTTSALTVRFGIDDGVELRGIVPDLGVRDGEATLGPLGVGAKIAARPSERFGLSVVPDVLVSLDGSGVGWRISANGGYELDRFTVWANATTTVLDGVEVFGGGGASMSLGGGGIFVNAGRAVVSQQTLAGGGGWWAVSDRAQIDVGCDLWINDGDGLIAIPTLGASAAF